MLVAENRKGSVISKHHNNTVLFQRKIIALIQTTWHQPTDNWLGSSFTESHSRRAKHSLRAFVAMFLSVQTRLRCSFTLAGIPAHSERALMGPSWQSCIFDPLIFVETWQILKHTHTQRLFRVQLPQAELKVRLYRWLAGEEGSTLKFQPLTSVGYQYYLQFRFGHPEF